MDQTQGIASLDLYVEELVLGKEGRFLREAGITFGRPSVGPVADDELPALSRRRLDLGRWRFTALVLPFDLEDLSSGRHYVAATVRMTFDDPEVHSLVVSHPSAREPDVRSLLTSQTAVQADAGDTIVDTWGVGRGELTWKLTARDGKAGLRARGRQVLAVLVSPLASDLLTGTLDAQVSFSRTILGVAATSLAEPRRPLRFALNVADGAFETTAAQ